MKRRKYRHWMDASGYEFAVGAIALGAIAWTTLPGPVQTNIGAACGAAVMFIGVTCAIRVIYEQHREFSRRLKREAEMKKEFEESEARLTQKQRDQREARAAKRRG